MLLIDVRCDGTRRSAQALYGTRCNELLYRIDPDTVGTVESKCGRCNKVFLWQQSVVLASTG